jgi:hypothetical protein
LTDDIESRLDELSRTRVSPDDDGNRSVPHCYPSCRELGKIARELLAEKEQMAKERSAALIVAKLAMEAMPMPSLNEIREAFAVLDKVR